MPKNKPGDGQVFTREPKFTNTLEIHVTGDLLPSSAFLEILELLKIHMDSKTIIFAVYNAKMLLLIHESVPSEFYGRIELYSPKTFEGNVNEHERQFMYSSTHLRSKEGLRRAG